MAENGTDINWSRHQNPLRRGLSNAVRGNLAANGLRVSEEDPSRLEVIIPSSPRDKVREALLDLPVKPKIKQKKSSGLLTRKDVEAMQEGNEGIIKARAALADEARRAKYENNTPKKIK